MSFTLRIAAVMGLAFAGTGCATLGPQANVSLQKAEIDANKNVGNIVVSGITGAPDQDGVINKAVATSALSAYGGRARPVEPVAMVLGRINMGDLADLLTAPYQAEFASVIEQYKKNPGARPNALHLPDHAKIPLKLPTDFTDMQQLQAMINDPGFKTIQTELQTVGQAMKTGGMKTAIPALAKTSMCRPFLAEWDAALFDSLGADHILLTYVDGSMQDFEAGKEVQMYAALVNLKTGKFRYFAETKTTKGAVPYSLAMGLAAGSLFDSASDQDALPELASN